MERYPTNDSENVSQDFALGTREEESSSPFIKQGINKRLANAAWRSFEVDNSDNYNKGSISVDDSDNLPHGLMNHETTNERSLRFKKWSNMPKGSKPLTEWCKNATTQELQYKKDFDEQLSEIKNIWQEKVNSASLGIGEYDGDSWNTDMQSQFREKLTGIANELMNSDKYDQYAVAMVVGPSSLLSLSERNDNPLSGFDLNGFINGLSDSNLDETSLGQKCRADIATELEKFANHPNLNFDAEKFVKSESNYTKLNTLKNIKKVLPDFSVEDYLAVACEDEPRIVCKNAQDFLEMGYDFPAIEIVRKYKTEVKQDLKNTEDEWKAQTISQFEDDVNTLINTYEQYNKLSDNDKTRINRDLDDFHEKILGVKRTSEEIILSEIQQATIESFNQKYQEYLKEYAKLDRQYYHGYNDINELGEKLDVKQYHERTRKLAAETITKFDDDEVAYFRREFIRRSYLYEGDEDFINDDDKIDNGKSGVYDVLHVLYKADEKFRESNEYRLYKERETAREEKESLAKLANMSEEELHILRRQHLEYKLNGKMPFPEKDETGHSIHENCEKNREIEKLWKYDKGWEESEEGQEYDKKIREKWANRDAQEWTELLVKYPEIFKNPDLDEIDRLIEETIKRIPRDKVYEVGKLKEAGKYRQADQAEIDLFVEIFNLDYNPRIEYSDKDTDCSGSYSHRIKRVEVRRQFGGRDDENGIVNTIAHEMWHAHQHDEADHGTKRGKEYQINHDHYQNGHSWDLGFFTTEGYNRYRNQLLEVEAFAFGQAFADYYGEVMENGIDSSQNIPAELDELIAEKKKIEKIKKMSPHDIVNNISELKENGFDSKEIAEYLVHSHYIYYPDQDKTVIINTMIDNHASVEGIYTEDDLVRNPDYGISYYDVNKKWTTGWDIMIEQAPRLLANGISELDLIDSLDFHEDLININDHYSGRQPISLEIDNGGIYTNNHELVRRYKGIQDLLLAVYDNESSSTNLSRARERVEKAIDHILDLRDIKSSDEREREKIEYLYAMLERGTE